VKFKGPERLYHCKTIAGYIADPAMPEYIVQWWKEAVGA